MVRLVAQDRPRALKPLVDGVSALEETQRDLGAAEAAQRLERQHDLRVARQLRIAAHEQQAQLIVSDFVREIHLGRAQRRLLDRWRALARALLLAQRIEHAVVGDAKQPGALVVWQPLAPRHDCSARSSAVCTASSHCSTRYTPKRRVSTATSRPNSWRK